MALDKIAIMLVRIHVISERKICRYVCREKLKLEEEVDGGVSVGSRLLAALQSKRESAKFRKAAATTAAETFRIDIIDRDDAELFGQNEASTYRRHLCRAAPHHRPYGSVINR